MHHAPTFAAIVATPLYVLLAFSSNTLSTWTDDWFENHDPAPTPITIAFVGDIMFDRYIREKAETVHGYDGVLAGVAPLLRRHDLVFGNLEGPITTSASVADYRDPGPNHYKFTFATSVAATLADAGMSAVTLGNNHTLNFGTEGLTQTKTWLEIAGVGYVGAPDDPYTPWRTATGTHNIALFAYDAWHTDDTDLLRTRIGAEATSTFVVVLAHWGEEYDTTPNDTQVTLAHTLIDAGADLVVGTHPHVVQNKEEYAGRWIYYSLGNFVFDQYFSDAVRCGAILSITLRPNNTYTTAESFIELNGDGTTATSTCMTTVPTITK